MANTWDADRIVTLRAMLGPISQEELAARVGVSRQQVSLWEMGRNLPSRVRKVILSKLEKEAQRG